MIHLFDSLLSQYVGEIPDSGDRQGFASHYFRIPIKTHHEIRIPSLNHQDTIQYGKDPAVSFGDPQDLQAMIGPLKNALSDQRLKAKALVEVGQRFRCAPKVRFR